MLICLYIIVQDVSYNALNIFIENVYRLEYLNKSPYLVLSLIEIPRDRRRCRRRIRIFGK